MTIKISELRVGADFDASKYQAGMAQKVAADSAGAASSVKLAAAATESYQKVGRAGDVLDRLSRQYVDGYAASTKFQGALRQLGRGLETGIVPMERASSILDGIYKKFKMQADGASIAEAGYEKLARAVTDYSDKLARAESESARLAADQARRASGPTATSALAIDQRLNIQQVPGTSAARAADIEAYGKSLDDLRAKFSPLYAIERSHKAKLEEINKAHKVGALSAAEMATAVAVAEHEFTAQSRAVSGATAAITGVGKGAALAAHQMTNLSFQINDVATQAALGMPPLRILAAQAGQFYQILQQGQGGIRGSIGYLGSLIAGLITPFRLVIGAAGAFVAAAVAAGVSWANAQTRIELALTGVGARAGVTAEAINRISLEVAKSGDLSVSEARNMGIALASTGKISEEILRKAVGLGKNVALVFGTDAKGAAEILTRALADPWRGVDDLNQRLGAWDGKTTDLVKSLSTQGRVLEAQRTIIEGVQGAVEGATEKTNIWTRAWDELSNKVSDYYGSFGSRVDRAAGDISPLEKLEIALKNMEAVLDSLERRRAIFGLLAGDQSDADAVIENVRKLGQAYGDLFDDAQRNEKITRLNTLSGDTIKLARSLEPFQSELQKARDQLGFLSSGKGDTEAFSRLSATQQTTVNNAIEALKQKVALGERDLALSQKLYGVESQRLGQAKEDYDLALQNMRAHSTAEKVEATYREALANARRGGGSEQDAVGQAQLKREQKIAEIIEQQSEAMRDRQYQAQVSIQQNELENSLIGRSVDVSTRLTAQFQLLSAAKQEAFKNRTTVSIAEEVQALADAERMARDALNRAQQSVRNDLAFSGDQLGRTPIEHAVYSRMQSAGLLDNGRIVGAQNEMTAAQIRLNEELQRSIDVQKGFASTFLHDMLEAKSATEALADALNELASKILDNSLDTLFAGLTRVGGVPTGGLFGGNILAGVLHDGGVAGVDGARRSVSPALFASAPRYHGGGVAGLKHDEVPAVLQRGEVVLPRGYSGGGGGGGDVHIQLFTNIDATGAYPESIEDIKAALARQQATMPATIARQVRSMRDRALA